MKEVLSNKDFNTETNNFDKQTAWRAPIGWLKYTTEHFLVKLKNLAFNEAFVTGCNFKRYIISATSFGWGNISALRFPQFWHTCFGAWTQTQFDNF